MTLYLVRHAQPLLESGVCYGASDVACDPQALHDAATQLLQHLPRHLPILSSPLQRCEHLAQSLCRLEPSFASKTDSALAEMHFGNWELRPWSSIAAQELSAWTDDFAHHRCGSWGESAAQFVQRVAARLLRSLPSNQNEIWITHAGVIRALLWLQRQSAFKPWAQTVLRRGPQELRHRALPSELLSRLQAADWPQDRVAFGQVLPWVWTPDEG